MIANISPHLASSITARSTQAPALIVRPLRYIVAHDSYTDSSTGTRSLGRLARDAKKLAAWGRGDLVQRMARNLAQDLGRRQAA